MEKAHIVIKVKSNFAVVNLTQVSKVKLIVNAIDPTAFMIITDTSEVAGRGFTIKMPENIQAKIE